MNKNFSLIMVVLLHGVFGRQVESKIIMCYVFINGYLCNILWH